jgi:signal transduction histidine kinase
VLVDAQGGEHQGGVTQEIYAACDEAVLASMMCNLLSNAAKYGRGSTTNRVTVRVQVRATLVHVEVEDTGTGFPAGMENQLFEPYVRALGTAERPGLGLGLATVKRFAVAHGGAVGAQRTDGGSIFWFELPLPATARATKDADGDERSSDAGGAVAVGGPGLEERIKVPPLSS